MNFIIENQKQYKNYIIYQGNFVYKLSNGEVLKSIKLYVAEKNGVNAHGYTIKKAISDVEFKIQSEKLKNEPITLDTVVSIDRYRAITGACEAGIKEWLKLNKIEVKEMKTENLLPLLEKTNAYGYEKIKQLMIS